MTWLRVGILAAAQFMVAFDNAALLVALPRIARAFGLGGGQAQWVITVYATAFAGLLIAGGRLADRCGRQQILLIGSAGFGAASLMGALAPTAAMLIAARGVQGIAGALMVPSALGLITAAFPSGHQRNRALSANTALNAAGYVVGVAVGGLLTGWLGWRSVLLVNVPIALLIITAVGRSVAPVSGHPRPLGVSVSAALTGGVLLLLLAADGAGAGDLGRTVELAGAVCCLCAVVRAQHRSLAPLVPRGAGDGRQIAIGALITLLSGGGNAGAFAVLSLYLQQGLKYSPAHSSIILLVSGLPAMAGGAVAPRLIARWGDWRALRVCLVIEALGLAVIGLGSVCASTFVAGGMVLDAGYMPGAVACTVIVMETATVEHQGAVGGILSTAAMVGIACGVAGAILAATAGVIGPISSQVKTHQGLQAGLAMCGALCAAALAATAFSPTRQRYAAARRGPGL